LPVDICGPCQAYTNPPTSSQCHLSKRGGGIKGGPQMGEGGMVVINGNMNTEVTEVIRTKRIRCLFQYGEGVMNANWRFVDFNPSSKRRNNRGNVYMKVRLDKEVKYYREEG
jgi:hypothetical protein